MRAVFWKEWREMLIPAVMLAVIGALVGLTPKFESHMALIVFTIHGSLGVALGAWQAFLDRRAMGDAFLRHRPLAPGRMHAARSIAGLVAVVAVSWVSLAVTLFLPWGRGYTAPESLHAPGRYALWVDWSPVVAAFAVALAVAGWAAVRLGASMGGRMASLVLAATLPALLVLSLHGTSTNTVACVLAISTAVAAAVLVVVRQSCGLAAGGSR